MANEPSMTLIGNVTADPELRFTQVPREFTNSEASNGGN